MIYRYYQSVRRAVDVISSKRLYFANPRLFNDPLESVIMFDRQRNENGDTVVLDRIQYAGKGTDGFGICCFCEEFDNYLLWSYYANAHKGVCIGFDFDPFLSKGYDIGGADLLSFKGTAIYLKRVVYEPAFFELPYWDDSKKGDWSLGGDDAIHVHTHKIPAWEKEHEIRAFVASVPDRKVSIPPSSVREVICGVRSSVTTENAIRRAVERQSEAVGLFRMDLDPKGTGLSRRPLS